MGDVSGVHPKLSWAMSTCATDGRCPGCVIHGRCLRCAPQTILGDVRLCHGRATSGCVTGG
jgi:hypothetical protein